MLKNILNLDGTQELSKNEQKAINGGLPKGCVQAWVDLDDVVCGPNGGTLPGSYRLVIEQGYYYCCPN